VKRSKAPCDLRINMMHGYCCNMGVVYMTCNIVNPIRSSNNTKLHLLHSLDTLDRTT